jgi:hypothetical protein
MAALRLKEDAATGRLTLSAPITSRLGGMLFGLVWLVFLGAFFLLPMLSSQSFDVSNLIFVLVLLVFSGGSSLISSLTSTIVTLDRGSRTLTTVLSLLVVPLRTTTVPFTELANVEVQYYRQSSGRSAHDAWRVNAVGQDGKRIRINWDGSQAEMADLAQKLVSFTGAPLLDSSLKPQSTMQRIFGPALPPVTPSSSAPADGSLDMDDTTSQSDQAPADAQPQPTMGQPTDTDTTITEPYLPPAADTTPMPTYDTIDDTTPVPAPDLSRLSASELEQRVQGDAMDSDARYALGRKYHAQGQYDRAIGLYQDTLKIDSSNGGAQNDLGVAFQQRGKRTEAEAAYRRAIALDPFSSTPHLNLGLLLSGMKRASDASQEFLQARRNANGDAETRAAEAASAGMKMDPQLTRQ